MARQSIVTIGALGVHPAFSEMTGPQLAGMADVIDPIGAYRRQYLPNDYDGQNEWALQSPNPYADILDDAAPSAMDGPEDDPGPPPAETGPDGAPTSTSTIVAWAQQALTALASRLGKASFDPHGVDGQAGPNTAAAVRAFQAWAGITADGLIGPQTTSTLAAKLSGGAIFPVGPKVAGVPVVPVAIGAIALGGLAWWFLRKRKR